MLSKIIQIKYKYQLSNLTENEIELFQHNSNFLIARLAPNQTKYIFYYNFIPKKFLFRTIFQERYVESCDF